MSDVMNFIFRFDGLTLNPSPVEREARQVIINFTLVFYISSLGIISAISKDIIYDFLKVITALTLLSFISFFVIIQSK